MFYIVTLRRNVQQNSLSLILFYYEGLFCIGLYYYKWLFAIALYIIKNILPNKENMGFIISVCSSLLKIMSQRDINVWYNIYVTQLK